MNLFTAVNLAYALGTDKFGRDAAKRCLEDDTPSHFSLGATELAWNDHRLSLENIEAARKRHGATFGNCSLDEPDAALASEIASAS